MNTRAAVRGPDARCRHCGQVREAPVRRARCLLLVAPLWAVPVAFAAAGYYPFGVLVLVFLSVWAVQRYRLCARCGRA